MIKLIYLKSTLKCDSFDVGIDIKTRFLRVLVAIEPGRSLLQFVTTNCLIMVNGKCTAFSGDFFLVLGVGLRGRSYVGGSFLGKIFHGGKRNSMKRAQDFLKLL